MRFMHVMWIIYDLIAFDCQTVQLQILNFLIHHYGFISEVKDLPKFEIVKS